MDIERRSVLKALGGISAVGTTGCVSSTNSETTTGSGGQDDSMTKPSSSTSIPIENYRSLSFTANTLKQQSSKGPAQIKAKLSNTGKNRLRVGFGPTLITGGGGPALDWSTDIVPIPEDSGVKIPGETRKVDDCWRFLSDEKLISQGILEWRKIDPDTSVTETYKVYTREDSGQCLPQGTYRYQDEVSIRSESQSMTMTLIVHIDKDHTLSAEATLEIPGIN